MQLKLSALLAEIHPKWLYNFNFINCDIICFNQTYLKQLITTLIIIQTRF